MHGETLNKAQCEILGLEYPLDEDLEALDIKKELSLKETNLFLFLRGKLALQAQEQIVRNYELVADFHKKNGEKNSEKKEKPKVVKIDTLTIYCDGACKGNPGKAGSGLAIYAGSANPTLLYGAYEARGTNNTAELNALYKALLIASESKPSKVTICCDSKYSIDCISTWAYGWKKNGWKKKGGEIKNLAIIKQAHELYESIKNRVTIKHVKGHSGVEGNELADRMAGYAIVSRSSEYETYEYEDVDDVLGMSEG
ncbi:reverse transcriptase-like protein [bacterium]|nr:reverse transcriptase-like protein [bacterium]MBU1959415.1 reverse transcriptase-like protein [bacterium]